MPLSYEDFIQKLQKTHEIPRSQAVDLLHQARKELHPKVLEIPDYWDSYKHEKEDYLPTAKEFVKDIPWSAYAATAIILDKVNKYTDPYLTEEQTKANDAAVAELEKERERVPSTLGRMVGESLPLMALAPVTRAVVNPFTTALAKTITGLTPSVFKSLVATGAVRPSAIKLGTTVLDAAERGELAANWIPKATAALEKAAISTNKIKQGLAASVLSKTLEPAAMAAIDAKLLDYDPGQWALMSGGLSLGLQALGVPGRIIGSKVGEVLQHNAWNAKSMAIGKHLSSPPVARGIKFLAKEMGEDPRKIASELATVDDLLVKLKEYRAPMALLEDLRPEIIGKSRPPIKPEGKTAPIFYTPSSPETGKQSKTTVEINGVEKDVDLGSGPDILGTTVGPREKPFTMGTPVTDLDPLGDTFVTGPKEYKTVIMINGVEHEIDQGIQSSMTIKSAKSKTKMAPAPSLAPTTDVVDPLGGVTIDGVSRPLVPSPSRPSMTDAKRQTSLPLGEGERKSTYPWETGPEAPAELWIEPTKEVLPWESKPTEGGFLNLIQTRIGI
jgi:hypothetical protein